MILKVQAAQIKGHAAAVEVQGVEAAFLRGTPRITEEGPAGHRVVVAAQRMVAKGATRMKESQWIRPAATSCSEGAMLASP